MDMYDKIDALLKEKGMSRRQLAAKAGINEATLSAAFRRRAKTLPMARALAIAKALDVAPNAFTDEYSKPKSISIDMTDLMQEVQRHYFKEQQDKYEKWSEALRGIVGEEDRGRAAMLLDCFIELNATGQEKALAYLKDMLQIAAYNKPSPLDELRGE